MKNAMNIGIRLLVMGWLTILPALGGAGQVAAFNQNNQYPVYPSTCRQQGTMQTAAPSASFRSTGTMMRTGSAYSSNPTIGSNGMASRPNYAPGGPRRAKMEEEEDDEYGGNAGTPGSTVNQGDQLPLGDAVLPLLLLAGAYIIIRATRVYRRKRRAV